jgi:hypothetical protein
MHYSISNFLAGRKAAPLARDIETWQLTFGPPTTVQVSSQHQEMVSQVIVLVEE